MAASIDPRLDPKGPDQLLHVHFIEELYQHYTQQSMEIWRKAGEWWDLFLARQADTRDPIDEQWRSDAFVPLPFSTSRTKAAQLTELLGNTEPIWQVEATRETGTWFEQSKHYERLLDYDFRQNAWRKFLYKLALARSVQGTAFFKVVWSKQSHVVTMAPTGRDYARFQEAIANAVQAGAPNPPNWMTEPEPFEKWRELINKAGKGPIPGPPVVGPREVIEYEGPTFQMLPIWAVRLDPMIDEMHLQKCIIHRMVKPRRYVTDRMDNDPESGKPYYQEAVEEAMGGPGERFLEEEEERLAMALGLNPQKESNPYYKDAVELWEVWSPDEPFQYSIIMNRRAVINKRPFERPLLTSSPNIFALRNVMLPGFMYGLSDYQEPEKLFKELNTFRRIRMDGATLTTLPAFVKQHTFQLTEALKKIKPGMIINAPSANAISSLIKHNLPPEAYREPAEIKMEIEDATEVYSSTKGAPATVGRVTGTEFAGRQGQTTLKFKVDASLVEEELMKLPLVCLSMHAQMGPERITKEVGGDPEACIDVTRDQLVEAMAMRFRFRGAVRNIQPDLQVQQLQTALGSNQDVLTPAERRYALRLQLEIMDIRGWSRILTPEGEAQITQLGQANQGAAVAGAETAQTQAEQAGVPVPGGGGGGQAPPQAA
jgi:hypothetical protein